jgi:nucleolar complex protein 2
VNFAPNEREEVAAFLEDAKVEDTPIGGWMRLQRKVRDQRRQEIEAVSLDPRDVVCPISRD